MTSPDAWRPDTLLVGFECLDLPLSAVPEEGEPDAPLVGTLVRRSDASLRGTGRALLYVHGWNDYFFHPHLAEALEAGGFAVYAVDLRRSGRSLRAGQYAAYVADVDDYFEELDAAASVIRESHDQLVVMGHSTGGLIAALWAAARPGQVAGVTLNSPWLDMFGPPALASLLKPVLAQWSRRNPIGVLPLPENDGQISAKSLHTSFGDEWDYSLELKVAGSVPIRAGWLRAILRGHDRVARGLDIGCPVFVAVSARTLWLRRYDERALAADVVLDVDRIAARSWRLGPHVTLVRIAGGMHDLALSRQEARERYLSELTTWLRAYVPARRSADAGRGVARGADTP